MTLKFDSAEQAARAAALLVSVRNAAEARGAIRGGCAILDVKEPARGSLGMAAVGEIAAILRERDDHAVHLPVSVALGEALDRNGPDAARTMAELAPIAGGIDFFKLGTAGLAAGSGWSQTYAAILAEWSRGLSGRGERLEGGQHSIPAQSSALEVRRGRSTVAWIAVAYADWLRARAPAPAEVIESARACGCRGVLIDTCMKDGPGVFGHLSVTALRDLADLARRRNLRFALAGRLTMRDVPDVRAVAPEIVGIRSAACRGGRREGEIDAGAVRDFREALGRPIPLVANRAAIR